MKVQHFFVNTHLFRGRRSRSRRNHANILIELQPLDFAVDAHHPVVPLGAASRLEYDGPARFAEARDVTEALPGLMTIVLLLRLGSGFEEGLGFAVPDHEARHRVLVAGRPRVFQVYARQGVVTRVVAVEGLVVVEKVSVSDL